MKRKQKTEAQYAREYEASVARGKAQRLAADQALLKLLPKDFELGDLHHEWKDKDPQVEEFGMYLVQGFGWCITTLLIKNASWRGRSAGASTARFYAVRIDSGQVVRIGHGPHVTATADISVKKSRVAALQKYVDMKRKGLADASMIRDRISSRRAQGALRRGNFISW